MPPLRRTRLFIAMIFAAGCAGRQDSPPPLPPPVTTSAAPSSASPYPSQHLTPSTPPPVAPPPVAPPPEEPPRREVRVPAACIGATLAFDAVKTACACRRGELVSDEDKALPVCDYDGSDADNVRAVLRTAIVVDPAQVRPGARASVVIRYSNTGNAPLRVLLERESPPWLGAADTTGATLPNEYAPGCEHFGGYVDFAHLALVVLPPGGVIEVSATWEAKRTKLVQRGTTRGFCKYAFGSALTPGEYKLTLTGSLVWELRYNPVVSDAFRVR